MLFSFPARTWSFPPLDRINSSLGLISNSDYLICNQIYKVLSNLSRLVVVVILLISAA